MEQIVPENWAILHLGIVFAVTLAQMLIVYVLSDANRPPAGLGLFTVYFMAALLGWIAVTLQAIANAPLVIDVPSVAAILNSYILFMAAGQRARRPRGRLVLGVLCLVACMSVFFLSPGDMFLMQASASMLFFAAAGLVFLIRARAEQNVGDAIMTFAALLMCLGMPLALFQAIAVDNIVLARTIAFGVHSCAYLLVAIGFLASVLVEYQQNLAHMATEDPLTRLLNRRGLEDALQVSLARAARAGTPTAAIMVDIDHFKKINDSFGHDTGDQVLRAIAASLQRLSRAVDVVARTGGEEFLMILPDTDVPAARVLAERIRGAIGDHPLVVEQQRIPVTVSLGVAGIQGDVDLDTLAAEADRAMYLAKRGGRNRVAVVENRPVRLSTTGTAG
jgi:diguanylate cyclase (GGDEF)-like protein